MRASHEDVDEVPLGDGLLLALLEDGDPVGDGPVPELVHAQPRHDAVRVRERRAVVALRLHHQADDGAGLDVQAALVDEVVVRDGVEVAVVRDVVDVAVDVVVHPARGDGQEVAVAVWGLGFVGHGGFPLPYQ
jgi:hypothetical protein